MKRIGILGGTFNPVHLGHLAMSQIAQEKFALNKVIFVPSYQPPHKLASGLAKPKQRYAMVRLAIQGNPKFELSNFEIKRKKRSFTIDTVRHFRDVFPRNTKMFFLIGADMLPALKTWKEIDEILKIVSFIAVSRPGYRSLQCGIKYMKMTMPGVDIASSYLRRRIQQGKSIKYLVPDPVFRYIEKNKVY